MTVLEYCGLNGDSGFSYMGLNINPHKPSHHCHCSLDLLEDSRWADFYHNVKYITLYEKSVLSCTIYSSMINISNAAGVMMWYCYIHTHMKSKMECAIQSCPITNLLLSKKKIKMWGWSIMTIMSSKCDLCRDHFVHLCFATERQHYIVTSSVICWART